MARVMVGHIGFHTAPDPDYLRSLSPGGVELGLSVFPPFRRQGYAREAAIAMVHWAHQTHGVIGFVMSIRPDNTPSQGLAAELGFVRIGSHIDEVDGIEEILEWRVSREEVEDPNPSLAPILEARPLSGVSDTGRSG